MNDKGPPGKRWSSSIFLFLDFHRGGKICLTDHFKPLWARNVPKFGIAHAMALGVSEAAVLSTTLVPACYFCLQILEDHCRN